MAGNTAGRFYLAGVGLAVALCGGIFVWLMLRSYERARDMDAWTTQSCMILKSEVGEYHVGEGVPVEYFFDVLYGYEAEGKQWTSDRYDLRGGARYSGKERVMELVEKYPRGGEAQCFVNPRDFQVAVLKKDSKATLYSIWFPGLFVVGGLGMMVGALRKS